MPYNNTYNQKIADELYQQDEDLIKHLNRESETPLFLRGSGSSGGRINIEDKYIENVLTGGCMNCGCQPNMNSRIIGGTGYGKATFKDNGFGQELGLGTVDFFKPSPSSKGGVKKMEKEDSKICYVGVGSGTKELKEDLGKFDMNRIKDWVGLGQHLKLKGKGSEEFKRDLGSFDFNKVKSWVGLGKYGKANSKIMSGAGFWEDFKKGFNMVFEPGSKYLLKPLGLATGNAPLVAGLTALGYGKAKRGRKSKMGSGLGMQPIQNANPFPIARPDEAWKLKKDRYQPMKEVMVESNDIFGSGTKELKEDLNKFDMNRIKDWVGLAKPKDYMALKKHAGLTGKGWEEFKKDLGSFDFNKVKSWVGLGKYGKANSKRMMGSGWWDSFKNFWSSTLPSAIQSVAMPINDAVVKVRSAVGLGKSGGGVSGGKAKRAEIVKKVMKDKSLSMIDASKFVKEHNLY